MNILFAIQGTGNGHLSRARDIYPELTKYGNVDVLISGIQADVDVPFPVRFKCYGLSFIFGKKGGVDFSQTISRSNLPKLWRDTRNLPIHKYDLVINDFEPVSAWACRLKNKPCIGLSHQCAVLHPKAPVPKKNDLIGKLVLQRYAPVTDAYGFHFHAFDDKIYTPVIRNEIRSLNPTNKGHYTVYLPAYNDDTLIKHFNDFPEVQWQVFSKHNKFPTHNQNVQIQPINNKAFIQSMASSAGVLCGAGFEGPAEALFLRKNLMVIPMHGQYEQQCNAEALAAIGVPVIPHLSSAYHPQIRHWLQHGLVVSVNYPDQTSNIIKRLMSEHAATHIAG